MSSGAASSVTVDQGTSLSQLVSVAFALKNPVTTMVPFGGFGNSSAGSVVKWNVPYHRRVRRRDLVATAG